MRREDADAADTASCPFCGGACDFALEAIDRNRRTTAERFTYLACRDCGTVFLEDVPDDLARYYEGDYLFDAEGNPKWRHEQGYVATARHRLDLLREHVGPGHLVEIGAGTGTFAVAAKADGFDVTVIEMNEECCRYMREHDGIRAICTEQPLEELQKLPPARAIAMWHVLEHLPDPAAALEVLASALEPGGVLALAVPNPRSLQFRILRGRWAHLDAPRHLCLVPPDALLDRAGELGLSCVEITTNDPGGLGCNLLGWVSGLDPDPPSEGVPRLASIGGVALNRALGPIERRGLRGTAVTVLLRRDV